jgi:Zn-dependent metalloprotease
MTLDKIAILIPLLFLLQNQMIAQPRQSRLEEFRKQTGASISFNKATGSPEFIRFPSSSPGVFLPAATTSQKTNDFLSSFPEVFGMANPADELTLENTIIDQIGQEHLSYQQYHHGVPVFAAKMKFHYGTKRDLKALNGVFIPGIKIDHKPSIPPQRAVEIAVNHVTDQIQQLHAPLQGGTPTLYIFRKGLIQGVEGANHLVFEVIVDNQLDVREFVYVDAHLGSIVEQFTGTHGALFRRLYEANTSNEIWTEGDELPGTLDIWQQNGIETSGHCYHFFNNAFGFASYDNNNAEMKTINNNPNINCPNANWNGSTANYCTGTASDDVVAHEWGHAYTEYTSGLIYAWQPGALNESYSDIWGETIDLLNGYEDSGEDLSLRNSCASSQRWRLGEDASAFGSAIRDMWDPTCKGDPGKISDNQYSCSSADNGGVHTNSGVNNHAYVLLVDGGFYNGQQITGLGFTKAAHIFWRAQSTYLTPTSDFAVQADALEAACSDLIGINLEGLSTTPTAAGLSGEIIDASDLTELQKVLQAVEMRLDPACAFHPILADSPTLCAAALPDSAIFFEDFESGLGAWTTNQEPENPGTWEVREWQITSSLPDLRPGTGVFGIDPIYGDCQEDLENGIIDLESPWIVVPTEITGTIELSFEHYISTEFLWDGGHVKYLINDGDWQLIPGSSFSSNGYNATLNSAGQGNDNPMAGKSAFTGSDGGSVAGSWGRSVVDLSTLGLMSEDSIKLKWEVSTDGCNGRIGWYLDDISVYSCSDCADYLLLSSNWDNQEILFEAATSIQTQETLTNQAAITYSAGQEAELLSGFTVELGSQLSVLIEGCQLPSMDKAPPGSTSETGELDTNQSKQKTLHRTSDQIDVQIYDQFAGLVQTLNFQKNSTDFNIEKALQEYHTRFPKGIYLAKFVENKKMHNFKFIVN